MFGQQATIRCGQKYYLFTIKPSQRGQPYLEITEMHNPGRLSPLRRQTFYIYPEYATKFGVVLNKMLSHLEQAAENIPTPAQNGMAHYP